MEAGRSGGSDGRPLFREEYVLAFTQIIILQRLNLKGMNQNMAKKIYLASTGPKSGKSIICLGLFNALRGMVANVGYFKPIGQKYRKNENHDKESIMIK